MLPTACQGSTQNQPGCYLGRRSGALRERACTGRLEGRAGA